MSFRTLDLNLLRVFDAVMSEGNLSRAAERLAVTQPAVSNAMKRLRETVAEDLFTRGPHGVEPTPRAQALWAEVRQALGQLRGAIEPPTDNPASAQAVYRLAMVDATAAMLLPELMARLQAEQAETLLEVTPMVTRDPRELLTRGDADFAIGHFPETVAALVAAGDSAPWRRQRLTESEYVCVMRRRHPLAKRELSLDAFCEARHVLVSLSGRAYGFVDQALAGLERRRRVVLTVNQFFTAARVVSESDLLTVLPSGFLPVTGYQQQLIAKTLPLTLGVVYVDAMWHVRHERSVGHQWLRAHMLAAAQRARAAAG